MSENKLDHQTATTSEEILRRSYSMKSSEDALAVYRDWAATYDDHLEGDLRYLSPEGVAALAAEWISDRDAPVLDIGCGTGLTGQATSAHGFRTIDGIDISPEMIAVALSKGIYRQIYQGDLTKPISLPDASYAGAVSSGTFTHGHVGAVAFDEIFRVLRKGAIFACTIHRHIFEELGFKDKIKAMEADGRLRVRHLHEAPLFETAEPDGLYYVFERL
ncbi:SAM-dependent methyltransferase [Rhodoligotrophos appendicifer]|uniref:class I SAM-dependent DNA methyltransferase n=1 Tax=Rhodoligotrophos appendicifer TaxID=987056 RepID=UPI00118491B7|nr:class I SAM-dependent methyltransferase [Rhodoligotrophos appendicifer]